MRTLEGVIKGVWLQMYIRVRNGAGDEVLREKAARECGLKGIRLLTGHSHSPLFRWECPIAA
jgi:hypothetical protein